jgi:tRNA nucleotidyltransferase (CCA-adding enzyme)
MHWNHWPVLRFGLLDVDTGAIPELRALSDVPQPAKHHPEIDTWVHVLMAVDQARMLTDDPAVRFAVLLHDLGKGTTMPDVLPQHIDHEERGVPMVHDVCDRLIVPDAWRELAALVCEHHTRCHRSTEMSPPGKRRLLRRVGAAEDPARLELFLLACEADARGRLGLERREYPQRRIMLDALRSATCTTSS